MATKKYLSLERLAEYDELIKGEISEGDVSVLSSAKTYTDNAVKGKADLSHTHDDRYYTETEIDSKISTVNASISNITNGTTVVKNAEHATSADSATTATTATSANSATVASKLGSTSADTGSTTQPIYLVKGVATPGSTYAGGTKVTLNGSGKGGSTASFYAPTGAGTKGHFLTSAGSGAPTWTQTLPVANGGTGATDAATARTNLGVYSTTEVDTKLSGKASSTHKHDDLYDAKGAAATAESNAKAYADTAVANLLENSTEAVDSIYELRDAMSENADAIEALNGIAAGKADADHTHKYAGSSSAGGSATSAVKVNNSLTVKLNSGTTEGTNMFTFNGSAAKSINITAASIGASASSHTHDDRYYTETEIDTKLSGKANTSHGNHVPAVETANNAKFLRNDNTWATVTPANIGAAASSHNHTASQISDLTATAAELNYMDGVTSNVQTQLDGKAATGHSHNDATTSSAGFMTAAMVTKLKGIATGANKTTVDTALSSTSTNPVQNKVVNSAISSATSAITANTNSITAHSTAISNLQTAVTEIQEITSEEIAALFA